VESEPWKYYLPQIKDDDGDEVKLRVDFGAAAGFVRLNDKESIEILDISTCKEGFFLTRFTLIDNTNQVEDPDYPVRVY